MKFNKTKTISPLRILILFLISSATIRLASFDITAVAQEQEPGVTKEVLEIPFTPSRLDQIFEALKQRELELQQAEDQIDNRRRVLNRTKLDIEQEILKLQDTEQRLAATLALADTAAENDIEQLATVYENMKPKDAAKLFSVMTPNFAAGFLSRMNPEAAAAIMTELEPDVGHTISVVFAGRNTQAFQE